jgi:hypothetical protein
MPIPPRTLPFLPDHRRVVVGFHGTDVDAAATIVAQQRFVTSSHAWEWLGVGVYFWEENDRRAWEWAEERSGARAAVVRAELDLGRCLDLLNGVGLECLAEAHELLQRELEARGDPLPVNSARGARRLDCAVVNRACGLFEEVQTIRNAFEEGQEAYPGAAFRMKTHIQVCVRDLSCIRSPIRLLRRSEVVR